jgi:hypothetical protein
VDDAQQRCTFIKADGSHCRGKARPGSTLCLFHNPADREATAEGRKKGGRRCRTPSATLPADSDDLPLSSVADIVTLLGQTINAVRKGRMDSKVGNCIGQLAGVLLKAIEGDQLARDIEELRLEVEGLKHDHHYAETGGRRW